MCCVRRADLLRTSGFRAGLLFMLLFGLGSGVLFGFVYIQSALYLSRQTDQWLAREIAGRVHETPAERLSHLDARWRTDPGQRRPFGLFAADGRLIAGNMPGHPRPPGFDVTFEYRSVTAAGRAITYRAMAHPMGDGAMVVVAQDVDELEDFSEQIVHALIGGGALMLLFGLGGAALLGLGSARRIDDVRRAIERIMAGHLSERLPVGKARSDVERLALVVNQMLDELERLVDEVKGVCDNIAHDMRTPLGRLLAGLERARRRETTPEGLGEAIDGAIEEVKEILRLFGALLRISEVEDGVRRGGFAALDLAGIATDAADYHRPAAEARGIALILDAPAPVPFEGDAGLLFEAIGNLLDNAIKFVRPHGHVRLSIAAGPVVSVADDGPGIPAAERQAVLGRFRRGEASRSLPGNGLGLALVAAVARLHGLACSIDDAAPGCVVTLSAGLAGPLPVERP